MSETGTPLLQANRRHPLKKTYRRLLMILVSTCMQRGKTPPYIIPILVASFDTSVRLRKQSNVWETERLATLPRLEQLMEALRNMDLDSINWDRLTELVHLCFTEKFMPTHLSWLTMVLIPKGGGNYGGQDAWK